MRGMGGTRAMGIGTWAARAATAAALALGTLGAGPGRDAGAAMAQNIFAPVATVDGTAINRFQVEQRAAFYALLRGPNSDFEGAREVLIDETLQVAAARQAGIELTAEELDAALVEFAARGELTPDQFTQLLGQAGIAPETFRDFIRNQLFWRRFVQARFGASARPSDAEVERRVARGDAGAGVRVLLSEIAIPFGEGDRAEVLALADQLARQIDGPAAFERAARRFSRAPSARRGGRLDYVPLGQLAPPIAAEVLGLAEGGVSQPVDLGGFVALFLLRDLDDAAATAPPDAIDYAEVLIPGGRTEAALAQAARLRARSDTCDDLYGTAPGRVERRTVPLAQLPGDLRQVLAGLDEDEASTLLATPGALRFVMLCARVREAPEGAFDAVGQQILNQRLGSQAANYLAALKADADIQRF